MALRIYNLDLLRFFAAMFVLLFHYTFRGYTADHLSPTSFPLLGSVFKYGYLGVNLFFIISGYVILMSAQSATVKSFLASRISRLYPAYWVAVTLTTLTVLFVQVNPFSVAWPQYLVNMTMLQGFFGVEAVDGAYWSLHVELKFYFLIGAVLIFNKMTAIDKIIIGWLLLSVLALFIPEHTSWGDIFKSIFITEWSSYFIAGMMFYLIKADGFSLSKIIMLISSLCLSIYLALIKMGEYQNHFLTPYSKEVLIAIIVLFYLVFFLFNSGRPGFLNKEIFERLGALTYPLYLIHQMVGYILFIHFVHYNKYLVLSCIILFVLVVSYLINRLVEKNLGPLLRRKILAVPFLK